jgi:dTDP-4-amino-4,6-dideoxy-D-galactose acyltransferase
MADFEPMIDHLNWDSDFFGIKTGRLQCKGADELLQSFARIREDNYQLIYVFSDTPIDVQPTEYRMLDVGGQVTYCQSLEGAGLSENQENKGGSISLYQGPKDNDSLLQLAFLSGQLSRFRVDPWLPSGCFKRLYVRWLSNNLENKEACRVYIAGSSNDPEGMLTATWKQGHGTIDLLAVRQDAQGKGIGSQLLKHFKNEAIRSRHR